MLLPFPVPVGGVDVKPLEEVPFPLKEIFQSREEEALAEAARPGEEEELLAGVYKLPDVWRLVDVDTIIFKYLSEVLLSNGVFESLGHTRRVINRFRVQIYDKSWSNPTN